jgi:hypothetical protein
VFRVHNDVMAIEAVAGAGHWNIDEETNTAMRPRAHTPLCVRVCRQLRTDRRDGRKATQVKFTSAEFSRESKDLEVFPVGVTGQ